MEETSPFPGIDVSWPAGTQILHPGSDEFTDATWRWSIYKPPRFNAAVIPESEEDVAKIVKAARAADIPFLAMGGRHGYGITLGEFDGGLAIDLSQMNTFSVDKANGTLTIGPGVKLRDITGPIEKAGYALPVGSCLTVGVIGVTIGAGLSPFQGLFGLMIDCLRSVRLITANGDLVEASDHVNSDLFWGIRGAGANFGIITSATYQLHKAVNNAQCFTINATYPADLKDAYLDVLQTLEDRIPPKLAIITLYNWDVDSDATQILATFIYCGPGSEAFQIIAPFLDLKPPNLRMSSVLYSQVQHTIPIGAETPPGRIYDLSSANIRRFAVDTWKSTFNKFDAFCKANPDARASSITLQTYSNEAVVAVPNDDTAYPWRDAKGDFIFFMAWTEPGNPVEESANALARELRLDIVATSGYPDLSVYVNYAYGDETLEQIYGKDKLPRLAKLKKEWDPDSVFKYHHVLPTEYP
ncbi:FAD-binding domain-containing protein [Annulohypoxylon maeteangense]|uniref:FAD-binding domain-containing protein n=1 Tax=Annulohypoxylon maeteangense TaxID=1927788 RepID=UPI002008D3DA|nr:FAD-binding domain-containing protein [Annulohypoxylon maeteangense]KAI0882108.1 FAD-binding domain-containing protein [Annulohypoxylon maeteangense]